MTQNLPIPPVAPEQSCPIQYGALCWRMHRGKVEVLLITSRDTGRWVIPKGWPMDKRTPAQAAAQEAWEEAGVQGEIAEIRLGGFDYQKIINPKRALACHVEVFALRVTKLVNKFPERQQRRRKWFSAEKAARKVNEPELRQLLGHLEGHLGEDAGLVIA
ncbi:MAG: NUDIX hydrolase [Rhodobacteraceae bacterium]|nr:NUDIX hydrolase [Cypionkella sp.]KAF0172106.1 MAG: NUDIX hydrolase [Paracoccaceae bacterium]MDO8326200.1 NUDIX hydrolase [Cypionkella sp.]